MKLNKVILLFLLFYSTNILPQVENVSTSDPVYFFLKKMQLKKIIDYNSSVIPYSREKVSEYLKIIELQRNYLSYNERYILDDLKKEYEFEIYGKTSNSASIIKNNAFKELLSQKKKYFYKFNDSIATLFINLNGYISGRFSNGDSLGKNNFILGQLGISARGTLMNSFGFSFYASNGQRLFGDKNRLNFIEETDQKFKANYKFTSENNNYDNYYGYLRYRHGKDVFSITIGRDAIYTGFGYIDRLFLSHNTVPYSFLKLDLSYGAFSYFFLYGSLKGDSLGITDIAMKNLVSHRLNINISKNIRIGLFESLITVDRPFNFTFLNPFSFLRSADYNAGMDQSALNNAFMGLDMEVIPVKNVAIQGSVLIDDLNFSTLFDNKSESGGYGNDNRFAWQIGAMWTDAFTLPDLTFTSEYTRINPFVYTHRTNKSQYTNWSLPLGHNLPPNSDEIAFKFDYYLTSRIYFGLLYQHQRSGNGFVFLGDSLVRNYGGNIQRGDADIKYDDKFLQGNRINRDIFTLNIKLQPIYQYFLDIKYVYRLINNIFENRKLIDNWFFITASVEF